MGRKSTLDTLPAEVKDKLDELLKNPAYTQKEVTGWMNTYLLQINQKPVMTERIVNHYAASMSSLMSRKRDSDEVLKAWIRQVGDIPDGDFGRAIVQILRTMTFELNMKLHDQMTDAKDDDLPGFIKMLKDLAFSVEKLEKSASENEKRDAKMRLDARAEAATELSEGLKNEGISEEVEASIRRILLGK